LPELVRERLEKAGLTDEMADIGASKASGFGTEKGAEQKKDASGHFRTAQTMFLTNTDVEATAQAIAEAANDAGSAKALQKVSAKDLQRKAEDKGLRPISVDIALFGRMVTSEAFLDVEASSQFAHAISTHKIDHEFDYYTAVDDLERASDDRAGAGADMIGDIEFNSACYYKYFNIHVEGLVDNLTGRAFDKKREVSEEDEADARQTAATAARALIEAACRVTPTGKQNSFAAHQLPSLVWVEIREENLPVSYANAFCCPVNPKGQGGLEKGAASALKEECETLTRMYGLEARSRLLLGKDGEFQILGVSPLENLGKLLEAVQSEVTNG